MFQKLSQQRKDKFYQIFFSLARPSIVYSPRPDYKNGGEGSKLQWGDLITDHHHHHHPRRHDYPKDSIHYDP